jgi:hypothetical protein
MSRRFKFLFGLAVLLAPCSAFAVTVSFSGSDAGGTASATAMFTVSGNVLTVIIENTSPVNLDNGSPSNSPAVTGFGFDTANNVTLGAAPNFSVMAYGFVSGAGSGALTNITSRWQVQEDVNLTGGGGGVTFDFVPNTTNGVKGGLINPNAIGATGSNLFETTATFMIVFDQAPGDLSNFFLRVQNVGDNGAGSLKLPGTPPPPPPPSVPEPASLFLLAAGGLALGGAKWKRSKGR